MERRRERDWIVARDDVGRAVLEWQGPDPANEAEFDVPGGGDLLDRLGVPELKLVDEPSDALSSRDRNPYDQPPTATRKFRFE